MNNIAATKTAKLVNGALKSKLKLLLAAFFLLPEPLLVPVVEPLPAKLSELVSHVTLPLITWLSFADEKRSQMVVFELEV